MAFFDYSTDTAPDPAVWLAIDESERISLCNWAHDGCFPDALHSEGNPITHCALHAVVETQIASRDPVVVGETVDRLQLAGLTRHAALHSVLRVLAERIAALSRGRPFDHAAYALALSSISASDVVADALGAPEPSGAPKNRAARRAKKKNKGKNRKT